jgi:hypothetical protein
MPPPLPALQRTWCLAPSEQGNVPDRCSCKITARHTELSRRPQPCFTVVHIHSIRISTCSGGAHERESGSRANRTAKTAACANTKQARNHRESFSLPPPLPVQQRTSIMTPSEQGNVPDRCSRKTIPCHAELSRRPRALCTRNSECSTHRHRRHHHNNQRQHHVGSVRLAFRYTV